MKLLRTILPGKLQQRGAVFIVMLVFMIMGVAAFLVSSLNSSAIQIKRDQVTADAMAQAKDALIGDAVSQSPVTSAGYLHLPDLGVGISASEGGAAPNFSGNNADLSVIGKLPWKTLGIQPLHDGQGECLWYVVSGRFKIAPQTSTLNWDTLGQIDVIDGNENAIASNVAALLVSPGQPLDGQNRALTDPTYTQCGGNYDAHNYLDSFNSSEAVSGEVNYFTGSTNNRIAPNTNNKRFVMTNNNHYNDRFLFVTADEIFRTIIRRSDFSAQISALMNDPYFQSVHVTGTKGTGSVNCHNLALANQAFCANWLEMLLLTRLPPASSITIDDTATTPCNRVLIFGGQRIADQVRVTATDKSNPANYLEGQNLAAFAAPIANSDNFGGPSTFNANNPSADLLRCLP